MTSPRISIRTLYLLALFQLVAGPLVLGLVFAFAKVAVREAPQQGLAKAAQKAWHSPEVRTALQAVTRESQDSSKSSLPKAAKGKLKIISVTWILETFAVAEPAQSKVSSTLQAWTPAWPQAPPGTPPRAA
ncbi:MAG: hypothetical protein JNM99_00650 [Verrucomicrobiaceae bacterium]|nr:hypothetical protein [Verrucomicrobiaceae bacterium]